MKARRAVVVALAVEEKKRGGAHRNSCASIRNRREYEMTKFVFHFATPNSTLASFLCEFFRTNICHGSPPRWVCVPPVFSMFTVTLLRPHYDGPIFSTTYQRVNRDACSFILPRTCSATGELDKTRGYMISRPHLMLYTFRAFPQPDMCWANG